MAQSTARYPVTAVEQWLYNIGFERGHPFGTIVADDERAYLEQIFVSVDEYYRLQGDETVLVYAPRGGGKSTLRVQLASVALPRRADATTLAVEFVDFERFARAYRAGEAITEELYGRTLLSAALEALVRAFIPFPEDTERDVTLRAERALAFPMAHRVELSRLIRAYAPHLLSPGAILSYLHDCAPDFEPSWQHFQAAVADRSLTAYLASSPLRESAPAGVVARLSDEAPEGAVVPETSWYREFARLRDILSGAGIETLHYLVDRIDEVPPLAGEAEVQATVLEPLLAYLPLLELPGIGFKFFLPRQLRGELTNRGLRADRLLDRAITIRWTTELLRELLDARIAYFSADDFEHFLQICHEIEGPEIQEDLLQMAQRSPRRLLQAARILCETHVNRAPESIYLTGADWRAAREEILRVMPPLLRIDLNRRSMETMYGRESLSVNEGEILGVLLEHGTAGCSRQAIIDRVWDGVANEQTLDTAIGRLRKKIGESGSDPIYLQTVRGFGFRLRHSELVE